MAHQYLTKLIVTFRNFVNAPKIEKKMYSKLQVENSLLLGIRKRDRDSAVGIATRYWLDGPGIESRWGQDFPHLSRPTLGHTQPPIQWVPGLSRG
jgi:hypothetical protein